MCGNLQEICLYKLVFLKWNQTTWLAYAFWCKQNQRKLHVLLLLRETTPSQIADCYVALPGLGSKDRCCLRDYAQSGYWNTMDSLYIWSAILLSACRQRYYPYYLMFEHCLTFQQPIYDYLHTFYEYWLLYTHLSSTLSTCLPQQYWLANGHHVMRC